MKRRDLIKLLEESGWIFIRHGGNHDLVSEPQHQNFTTDSKT